MWDQFVRAGHVIALCSASAEVGGGGVALSRVLPRAGGGGIKDGEQKLPSQPPHDSATPPTPYQAQSCAVTFPALTDFSRVRDLCRMGYTDSALTLVT